VDAVSLDFKKVLEAANAYAGNTYDSRVELELDDEERVGTYVMYDEEGVETARYDVTDAGKHGVRQMMSVTDEEGEYLVEAFGDVLARLMWA
jgi:hypothetical protein